MIRDLSKVVANEEFIYKNGDLYWRYPRSNRTLGIPLRTTSSVGYIKATFKNLDYYLHRVVWIMHNGDIPEGLQIDHINRVKTDNRIDNLRLVTRSQNQHNVGGRGNNKYGLGGVTRVESKNGWIARIGINKKRIYLGLRKVYFEACCLRKEAEAKYKKEIWG